MMIMKKFTFFVLLGLVFAFGAAASQTRVSAQLTGAYSKAKVSDKQVKAAAAFAVSEQAKEHNAKVKLVRITKAQTQVVAGMNYRVCMQVRDGSRGRKHTVTAVVYRDLQNKYSLTSWDVGKCSAD